MTTSARRTIALASSTVRDLLRRPGGLVALLVTGSLLLLLPRLARRALDDGATLGIELVLSTLTLHASLLGGLIAVHAGASGSPLGPVAEFLSTPLTWGEYVAGRGLGVFATASAHVVVLLLIAVGAIAAADPHDLPSIATLASGLFTVLLQAGLFVAAGLCAGAFAGGPLGTVVLAAFLVAARLVVPALTVDGTLVTFLIPDPARADLSRVIALQRPIGAAAWALVTGATLLQGVGLLVAAYWRLATRSADVTSRAG